MQKPSLQRRKHRRLSSTQQWHQSSTFSAHGEPKEKVASPLSIPSPMAKSFTSHIPPTRFSSLFLHKHYLGLSKFSLLLLGFVLFSPLLIPSLMAKSFTSHVPPSGRQGPRGRSSGGRWKIATVNESENRSYQ